MLAATVRDICQIDIIDANKNNLTVEAFEELLRKGEYSVVGVSVMMDQYAHAWQLIVSAAKRALPNAVTIMGGVYPTVSQTEPLENKDLDYTFCGEGK